MTFLTRFSRSSLYAFFCVGLLFRGVSLGAEPPVRVNEFWKAFESLVSAQNASTIRPLLSEQAVLIEDELSANSIKKRVFDKEQFLANKERGLPQAKVRAAVSPGEVFFSVRQQRGRAVADVVRTVNNGRSAGAVADQVFTVETRIEIEFMLKDGKLEVFFFNEASSLAD